MFKDLFSELFFTVQTSEWSFPFGIVQGCIAVKFSRFISRFYSNLFIKKAIPNGDWNHLTSLNEMKRRRWDSNPRALSDKRFSRPPRYDHFDTSPYDLTKLVLSSASVILSNHFVTVNTFFKLFLKKFNKILITVFLCYSIDFKDI